jgi:hypothetical protein
MTFFPAISPKEHNYMGMWMSLPVGCNLFLGSVLCSENESLAGRFVLIQKGIPKFPDFLSHALDIHFDLPFIPD